MTSQKKTLFTLLRLLSIEKSSAQARAWLSAGALYQKKISPPPLPVAVSDKAPLPQAVIFVSHSVTASGSDFQPRGSRYRGPLLIHP
jgi:hypothetical protein